MAKNEIAVKKYVVRLSAGERDRLEAMVRAGRNSAQILTRARILLKADVSDAGEGWSDSAIAAALNTSINNVARTRQQLVEEGFEATLKRKVQPQLRPAADFRRSGGGETDRSGLLAGSGGVRPLEPAPPIDRESRRIEHRREGQRQYDRTDAKKNVLKPHRNRQWVIPPEANAGFVAAMEDVLETPGSQPGGRETPIILSCAWTRPPNN